MYCRPTRNVLQLALITIFLMSISIGDAAAKSLVPLTGSGSSEYMITEITGNPDCEGGLTFTIPGTHSANLSHLGRTTATSVSTVSSCDGSFFGDMTFEAANGDEFYASYVGQNQGGPSPEGTTILIDAIIDGGTGRFENATGSFAWESLNINSPATMSSVDTFEIEGAISSVGSTRSANAVPEPTSASLAMMALLGAARLIRRRR